MPTIRLNVSKEFMKDLRELETEYRACDSKDAIFRAVAREVLLMRAVRDYKSVTIKGRNPNGKNANVLM